MRQITASHGKSRQVTASHGWSRQVTASNGTLELAAPGRGRAGGTASRQGEGWSGWRRPRPRSARRSRCLCGRGCRARSLRDARNVCNGCNVRNGTQPVAAPATARHARQPHARQPHARERYARERHTRERHTRERHTRERHTREHHAAAHRSQSAERRLFRRTWPAWRPRSCRAWRREGSGCAERG